MSAVEVAALGWPVPVGEHEEEIAAEWLAKVRRHHGRSSKPGFAPLWRFSADVEAWVDRQVHSLEAVAPRPVVHVCSGSSRLGDVRVDRFELADVKADAFALPLKDGTAGTVVSDPPWAMPYHLRHRLNRELYRIARPGAQLVWISGWMPDPAWIVDDVRSRIAFKASGWPADPLLLIRATKPDAAIGGPRA